IDWVSRLPNQAFAGKAVALQSASPGPVGGARVQYDMRKAMAFLDAFVLNKPEIFIGNCASRFDEKTGELKDEPTRGLIKQQLAAFATFIARVAPKACLAVRCLPFTNHHRSLLGGNSWLTNNSTCS